MHNLTPSLDEDWNDQVFALEPYTLNTNNRTLNTEDSILAEQNTDGYNGFLAYVSPTTSSSSIADPSFQS